MQVSVHSAFQTAGQTRCKSSSSLFLFFWMYLDKGTLILYLADNDTSIAGLIKNQWLLAVKVVYLLEAAEAVNQTDVP